MSDILPFLKSIISVSGLSGYETPVASLIEKKWTPLVDEITRSKLGSIHGLKAGSGSDKLPRPSVLIATHMDAIGLMVSRIVDGFLYVTNIGGVDSRVLPGTPVIVHASGSGEDLYGVVVMPPANLTSRRRRRWRGCFEISHGRYRSHAQGSLEAGPHRGQESLSEQNQLKCQVDASAVIRSIIAHPSLRSPICLEELQSKSHVWDVWALASVQEEVTYAGAFTSALSEFARPSPLHVDMTFGKGTGSNDYTVPNWQRRDAGHWTEHSSVLVQAFQGSCRTRGNPCQDEAMP